MSRLFSLICAAALGTALPAAGQDTATPDPAAAPVEAAPLVDIQVTIVNQSGQMLMRFDAIPIVVAEGASDGTTTTDQTQPDAPADPAATPDPRLSAGGELLKGGVVSAGNYGILTVPGGASVCTFTFEATLQDGQKITSPWNLCEAQVFQILPPG